MNLADRIRRRVLVSSYVARKGHIGPALSIVDIVAVLAPVVQAEGSIDRLVLSKGHAALAWYAALCELGVITEDDLGTYGTNGTLLGTHPDPALPGVLFQTGSLGMGLSYGVGLAIAAKHMATGSRTYVILSDSELGEGSTWEAALIAAQHNLPITVFLDRNGQQALGKTRDILSTGCVPEAWQSAGWEISLVDGHDTEQLTSALSRWHESPHLVIANTIAGKGVDFMEGRIEWHYMPLDNEQFVSAMLQIGATPDA